MLAANVIEFARALRKGGMRIPPERVSLALAALERVGVERREDVHAALSASLVDGREHQPFFDGVFQLFWADPQLVERFRMRLAPVVAGKKSRQEPPAQNRIRVAMSARTRTVKAPRKESEAIDPDMRLTASSEQRFQRADFETMTPSELRLAQRLASELPPPVEPIRLRRSVTTPQGHIDLHRTLRSAPRSVGSLAPVYAAPQEAYPPIVALVDISGSMERYTRVLLYYLHGLARRHKKVKVFTFGTVLTDVSRALLDGDPDVAMQGIDRRVNDWRGGTRLRESLLQFSSTWAKRLLSGRATLLLVTDGLDGESRSDFGDVVAAIRRRAHRMVWLNPLLRFDGFEPLAPGVKVLAKHSDAMLPIHNLRSLHDLQRALRRVQGRSAAGTQRFLN